MDSDVGKVFVGGVSWETTEDTLRKHFSSYGSISDAVIMRDRATGRARGFGFVVFSDPSVADTVVLEKHVIEGRTVDVKKAVPRDEQHQNSAKASNAGPRTKKIFVGGLAATITEDDFKQYFQQFGNITDAVVMYDHETQRPRGFGFITFDTEDAVEKVLQKNFHEVNEKLVEVKPAVPKDMATSSSGGGRAQGGGGYGGGGSGRGGGGGYGQGYNSNQHNLSYGPNQYTGPPAGRVGGGGYPPYGSGGYGGAPPPYASGPGYEPPMNGGFGGSGYNSGGGGYGGGYGNAPVPAAATSTVGYGNTGGYGASTTGSYGGAAPPQASGPRSSWGGGNQLGFGTSPGGGYGSGGGWMGGSGPNPNAGPPPAASAGGYGGVSGYGYGYGGGTEGGYVGYGAQTAPYGPGSGGGDTYTGGYQRPGGPDSSANPPSGYGGVGSGPSSTDSYGVGGKQTHRGADARFRPYPAHG